MSGVLAFLFLHLICYPSMKMKHSDNATIAGQGSRLIHLSFLIGYQHTTHSNTQHFLCFVFLWGFSQSKMLFVVPVQDDK